MSVYLTPIPSAMTLLASMDDDKPIRLSDDDAFGILEDKEAADWLADMLTDRDVAQSVLHGIFRVGEMHLARRVIKGQVEVYLQNLRDTRGDEIAELRAEIARDRELVDEFGGAL